MVGLVDYVQTIGATSGVVAEVEAASRARRAVLRSNDYDHGAYAVGFGVAPVASASSATQIAGQAVAGFQWVSSKNFMVLKEITAFVCCFGVNLIPAPVRLVAWKAVSFSQQFDTQTIPGTNSAPLTGVTGVPFGAGQKLRNTMLASDTSGLVMQHINNLTTDTINAATPGPSLVYASGLQANGYPTQLLGGVYTLDTLPLGQIVSGSVASGTPPRTFSAPMQSLFDSAIGPPLIMENYSGLIFTFDGPGSSVAGLLFAYGINLQWDEVTTYPLGNYTN